MAWPDTYEAVEDWAPGKTPDADPILITAADMNPLRELLVGRPWVNLRRYCAGDGVADDSPGIAAAIADAGLGGLVRVPKPPGFYRITAPIVPLDYQTLRGGASMFSDQDWFRADFNGPMLQRAGTSKRVTVEGLVFKGTGESGSKGIVADFVLQWNVRQCRLDNFGDQAIQIVDGNASLYDSIFIGDACLVRTGRTDYIGAFDIGESDAILRYVEAGVLMVDAQGNIIDPYQDGWIAGIVVRGPNASLLHAIGEKSEAGIVLTSTATQARVVSSRADGNLGHGFVVAGARHVFTNSISQQNSRAADDTYDGYSIAATNSGFADCWVQDFTSFTNRMRFGFNDASVVGNGEASANSYEGNRALGIRRTLYNFAGANQSMVSRSGRQGIRTVTGATAAQYADEVILADASGGAFTVTLPDLAAGAVAGATGKTLTVKRTSASNDVTVDGASTQTIDGALTKVLGSQHAFVALVSSGTSWFITAQGGTVT